MHVMLSDQEKNHLSSHIKAIEYKKMGNSSYITELRRIAYNYLPERLLTILEEQKSGLTVNPYIVIDNLPTDEKVNGSPNVTQTGLNFKTSSISENLLCMVGAILGEPYSIYFEGRELVNNLPPIVKRVMNILA